MSSEERTGEKGRGYGDLRGTVSPMRASDLNQIMTIERSSFSDPWPEFAFLQALTSSNCYARVARSGGVIVGYLVGYVNGPEMHVANVAVKPEARGKGIGRRLMIDVLITREFRCKYAVLDVRESNSVAIALYDSLGFRAVGRRVGYYRRPVEDAIVMRRAIPGAEATRGPGEPPEPTRPS